MNSNHNHQDWLTVAEAADLANRAYQTIRKHMLRGNIPYHVNEHGHYRIRRADVEHWIENRRPPGRPVKKAYQTD